MAKQRYNASYVVQTIRAFLDGSGGDRDWDDITSCPLRDPRLDDILRRASNVHLPCRREEVAELKALAVEVEQLARS